MDSKLFLQPEIVPLRPKDKRVPHPAVESIRNDPDDDPPRDYLVCVRNDPDDDPPRDYLVWSIVNLVYINPFCLALPALCWSIKARDRLHRGDVEGARSLGRKACWMNGILTAVFIVLFITSAITLWLSYRAVMVMLAGFFENLFGSGSARHRGT